MTKMKNDKYRRARGGKAFMIHLICKCGAEVLYYQKDGDGRLKRCYLNRIFAPAHLEQLQHGSQAVADVPALTCPGCKIVLGTPIVHHDGRTALRLRPGFYTVRRDTKQKKESSS
jgi:hypothetical protein